MVSKRRASNELENPSKVARLGDQNGDVFNNSDAGHQNVNAGEGNQFNSEIMNIYNHQADRTDAYIECLKDLRPTNPEIDRKTMQATKGKPLPESYLCILKGSSFHTWCNDSRSGLFWVKGSPGKGKTMLLCGIIDIITKEAVAGNTSPPAYFFCQNNDSRLNSCAAVLRGLIYLLVISRPPLLEYLRNRHKHAPGGSLFNDPDPFFTLLDILEKMLTVETTPPVYLIVDALDECRTDLKEHRTHLQALLGLIHQTSMSQSICVKWIVSSRNQQYIEEELEPTQHKNVLNLDQNEASVSAAVNTYIEDQVSQLTTKKAYEPALRATVRDYLRENANDTFLWVALVCRSLLNIKPRHTSRKLHAFPPGLESFYEKMLHQILESDEEPEDLDICKGILAVTLIARRPVTLTELPSLVELPADICNNPKWLEDIIKICSSFLILRQGTLYFVHQSAKEYLEKNASAKIFPSQPADEHYEVYSRSLRVLVRTLKRDICSQQDPGMSIDQIKPGADPLEAVRYSCIYWVDHFVEAAKSPKHRHNLKQGGPLHRFLQRFFLYWLEALSLIGRISDGVVAITRLETVLEDLQVEPEMLTLVEDARRFILHSRWLIEDTHLQAYTSALLFSPAKSLIRTAFKGEEPTWILTKPVVEDYWGACLQTLRGHGDWVRSVALSHDYSRFASASSDRSIKIWNAATGKCEKTLEGHSSCVNSLVFSHDNHYLVSTSSDKTLKLWDTDKCIRTLEGHGGSVKSVIFSHNNNIISASSDRTLKIWNITGECLRTLQGHSDWVNAVTCSGEGGHDYLASASSDRTIRIWDIEKGISMRILKGHSDWVSSVVFQPKSSTCLASASYDKTVRIWDIEKETCIRIFEGHSSWVYSVTFSHNGQHLASASGDASIRIWDTEGECKQILRGHGWSVTSLSFSPNDKRLTSASYDRSLKLWDTTIGRNTHVLEVHGARVESVVFSPDGNHLASRSDDQTIRIWNTAKGECSQVLEGHSETVNSAVFSCSGYLASASSDRTIKVWNVSTGHCIHTLEGHNDWVDSIVFSPDGKYLASASGDMTVKIWDVTLGLCVQTLTGHKDGIRSVVFSNDGRYVASASTDYTVRVWDTVSGNCAHIFDGYNDWVTSVIFSHDDKYIASISADRAIKIWTLDMGKCTQIHAGHRDLVYAICFSHDGQYLASTAADGAVKIWVAATGDCLRTIDLGTRLKDISFDPTNAYLFTELGRIVLGSLARLEPIGDSGTQRKTWYGYGLSSDRSWITCHGQDVLQLPSEYRVACSAVFESMVAVGCESGRVLLLGFTPDRFPTLKSRGNHHADGSKGYQQKPTSPNALASPTPSAAATPAAQETTSIPEPEYLPTQKEEALKRQPHMENRTPLHLAVLSGEESVVRQLLEDGEADQDAKDLSSRTALFYAMKQSNRNIALSLARKWNVPDEVVIDNLDNQTYEHKARSLFRAIKRLKEDEIGFLVEIGADLEAIGYGEWPGWKGTALHEAAWFGTLSMIHLLLENGANKNARDIGGRTPAFRPNWSRTAEIAKLLS